jgi:hypothetical protein
MLNDKRHQISVHINSKIFNGCLKQITHSSIGYTILYVSSDKFFFDYTEIVIVTMSSLTIMVSTCYNGEASKYKLNIL